MDDIQKIVKVKMVEGRYDQGAQDRAGHGKMVVGKVYEFPREQAERMVRAHIAEPAPADAVTAREEQYNLVAADAEARSRAEGLDAKMQKAWDEPASGKAKA